jgi:hypothetical protein
MSLNGFSVGSDYSYKVNTPTGILRLPQLTEFTGNPQYVEQKIVKIDGTISYLQFPDGHGGSFSVERNSGALDSYFAAKEANYYAGGTTAPGFINETVVNPDGSVQKFRYEGVELKYADSGTKTGQNSVKQRIDWTASRKIEVK